MNTSNIVEIPAFFQKKTVKRFTFTDEGIKVEKLLSFDPPVFIPSENIIAFRYGVKIARGYAFAIGRHYIIETKDTDNNVFKIKLHSYYSIRRDTYHKIWSALINQLWENYFVNIYNYYIELYNIKQVFEISGVSFYTDGISWDKNHKLLWNEIALSNYRTYFMIYHINDPKKNRGCNFSNDWNALLLQSLLKGIIKQQRKIYN